ncbi:MAG: hypothetical protein C0616_05420 [Desulfuromonas sp.]|nr:MAG: hypothetical protein C0616_05420 [Desulfuromonas sp.]
MYVQTTTLRRQHGDIRQLQERLQPMLRSSELKQDTEEVRALISRLVGVLSVHLAMEDEVLYRGLAGNADEPLQGLLASCREECGHLSEALIAYQGRWPTPRSVQEAPEQFILETGELFSIIDRRLELEETTIFPAIDSMNRS